MTLARCYHLGKHNLNREDTMDDQDLMNAVCAAAFEENGRRKLACVQAFELSAELGVPLLDINRVCNREGIRICKCQLGCFR